MSIDFNSFRKNSIFSETSDIQICGLENFVNRLQQDFYATVNLHQYGTNHLKNNLVIEITCSLHFYEVLHHFKNKDWGWGTLQTAMEQLQSNNKKTIDIEELSFSLLDTTIFIHKIYNQSIVEHIHNLLVHCDSHYQSLTKNGSAVPYEIFIPVFENKIDAQTKTWTAVNTYKNSEYLKYWALYYESYEDPLIYDLNKKQLMKGNLFMLNS